jgi:signal transduction histidine kinase
MDTVGPWFSSRLDRDGWLALAVAVLSVIGSEVSLTDENPSMQAPSRAGVLLLPTAALTLAVRSRLPLTVFALNAAASGAYHLLGYRPVPLPLGVLVAVYTIAVRRPLLGGAAAAVYLAGTVPASMASPVGLDDDHIYAYLVSVVATVAVGYGVALGRARASLAERRNGELAHEQDARTRFAVEQEQARIAREVHDIVAHDVSVIVAQAAAAHRVLDRQPETVAPTLASIEAVGRDALDGLRRLMGLLRTGLDDSERSPQPSLDRLPWLVSQVRRAGLPVDLTVRGRPRPLPATLELNAYRIVQEALTNSIKHAGPTRATVALDYQEEWLDIEVRDHGRGAGTEPRTGTTPGFGLISMQQRVAMHGGSLTTGSGDEDGFRVSARLPLMLGTL